MAFDADGDAQYFAKFTLNDDCEEVTKINSTEDKVRHGGQPYDMNPIIFIRASKPSANALEILPTLKLTDFFPQSSEDEAVAFELVRTGLKTEDLTPLEIRDDASKKFLADLKNFTPQ